MAMIDINGMLIRKPRHEQEYKISSECFEEAQGCGTVRCVADLMVKHFKTLYPDVKNMVNPRFLGMEIEELIRGRYILEKFLEAVKTNNRALLQPYENRLLVLEVRDDDCPKHQGRYNENVYASIFSSSYGIFFCPKLPKTGSPKNIVYEGQERPVCTAFGRKGMGAILK